MYDALMNEIRSYFKHELHNLLVFAEKGKGPFSVKEIETELQRRYELEDKKIAELKNRYKLELSIK